MKSRFPGILTALLALTLFLAAGAGAEESAFVKSFLEYKQANNFAGLKYTITRNKDIIPGEIDRILKEARAEGLPEYERVRLLDLAYQIARMHEEWNGGDSEVVMELEVELAGIRQEKEARREAAAKVTGVELVPGNFVMNEHADEMKKAGLAPVVYPHWVHRSFFRCKVCHENVLIMKRGANGLSQEKIARGEQCGACHNGGMSFSATDDKNCSRCHLFDTPGAAPLVDLSYYDPEKFTLTAARLGGRWEADRLPDGRPPLDKLGFIDWIEMDRLKAFEPLSSLGEDAPTEGVRETSILFPLPEQFSSFLKNVLFSHRVHTTWVNCSICHGETGQRPRIFEEKAGATRVTMIEIKEGTSCGTCHGRVAFPVSDCKRCHNHAGRPPEGAFIRQPSGQTGGVATTGTK